MTVYENGVNPIPGAAVSTHASASDPHTGYRLESADHSHLTTGLQGGTLTATGLPQGRLTLTTGVPVLAATVAASATVLYTPYIGNMVPIWDGAKFVSTAFTELTNTLANATTNPAAAIAASNYDLFVWSNAGTLTLSRGPLWTSDTGRGTGAGTTELTRVNGILTNTVAITNGPGAGLGTYLGTVRTDAGGATVSWSTGGTAAGGTPGTLHVWNMYNRVISTAAVNDASASWTYTSSTVRAANASNGNRVSFVRGVNEDGVSATYTQTITAPAVIGAYGIIGIGIDSVTAYAAAGLSTLGEQSNNAAVALFGTPAARYSALPGLGFHYLQALEQANNTNAATFGGGGLNLFETLVRA